MYIVLGMHKSGTSLISEMLHASGVAMVDEVDPSGTYDAGRKFERPTAVRINNQILGTGGRLSLSICESAIPDELTPQVKRQICALVEEQEARGIDWGFKDPRTCLTYHLWYPLLPPHKIVAVFRPPEEVIRHYHSVARPTQFVRALRRWREHNQRILSALESDTAPFLVLDYRALMTAGDGLRRLARFIGREVSDRRNPRAYRQRSEESWLLRVGEVLVPGSPGSDVILGRLRHLAECPIPEARGD